MTAIPATLSAPASQTAIVLTLDRLKAHALTPTETESDLLSLFDVDKSSVAATDVLGYLAALLHKLTAGEVDSETASEDIQEVLNAWREDLENARALFDIGAD
jgi:hypothetical protein